MTQQERLLRAMRERGHRGVTAVDFMLPAVCDGGPPITRVAARIEELKDQGYIIATQPTRRDRCVVYWLVREPTPVQPATEDDAETQTLFDPQPSSAIYGDAA